MTILLFHSTQRRNGAQEIENAADIYNWDKKNSAMQNIFGAIKEEQSRILMTCSTAQEMWIKRKTEYEELPLIAYLYRGLGSMDAQSGKAKVSRVLLFNPSSTLIF